MKKALLYIGLVLLLISCSNNAVHEKLFSATNSNSSNLITNYAELRDFFSDTNQETEGYVANDITLEVGEQIEINSNIDKTLYLNGHTIKSPSILFSLGSTKSSGNITICNVKDESRSYQNGVIESGVPIYFYGNNDNYTVTIKDIDLISNESSSAIVLNNIKDVILENLTVIVDNPKTYQIQGIYLTNSSSQKIDNVNVSINLTSDINNLTSKCKIHGILAEGVNTQIKELTNSSVKINTNNSYVYKLSDVIGMELINVDLIKNCRVNINNESNDNIKADNIYGVKLCNGLSMNSIYINIGKVGSFNEGSVVGLYAFGNNSELGINGSFENVYVTMNLPQGSQSSTFEINKISGISINNVYDDQANLDNSNTNKYYVNKISGKVDISKESNCKKLIGVEYRATKGTVDLRNLEISIDNKANEFYKLYGIALDLSNEATANTDESKITYSVNNPTLNNKCHKITNTPE